MSATEAVGRELAAKLIEFLERGEAPSGLFTPDVLIDFTMPQWRLQAQGFQEAVELRLAGHPGPSRVPRSRFDTTATSVIAWHVCKLWRLRRPLLPMLSGHGIVGAPSHRRMR